MLDLAMKTGIAATNIQRMEAGTRPPPSRDKIEELARGCEMDARSTQLLLFLTTHTMPEILAHLALQERGIAFEDFESASLMRWVHVSADALSKPTWLRIVQKISCAREGAEREASLTVTPETERAHTHG